MVYLANFFRMTADPQLSLTVEFGELRECGATYVPSFL